MHANAWDTDVAAPASRDLVEACTSYAGVFVGAFAVALNAAALASVAKRPILKVGARVPGSWSAAITFMARTPRLNETKVL